MSLTLTALTMVFLEPILTKFHPHFLYTCVGTDTGQCVSGQIFCSLFEGRVRFANYVDGGLYKLPVRLGAGQQKNPTDTIHRPIHIERNAQ